MFGLDPTTRNALGECFAQFPHIEKVLIYGSRAKGTQREGSDVDLSLLGKGLSPLLPDIAEALDDLNLPYRIDLSDFINITNAKFQAEVLHTGKTLYTKKASTPKHWQTKTLGEVCEIEYGTRVVRKKDAGNRYPVYGGGGATFYMDTFNRENRIVISRFAISEQCTRFVQGKFFLNDSGLTIKPLDPNLFHKEFLNYQIINLNDIIYSLGKGTAQRNLNVDALKKIFLYLPPLEEQQRIVAKLDAVLKHLDQLEQDTRSALQSTGDLWQSTLEQAYTHAREHWQTKTLGEVCEQLFAGGDVPKKHFSKVATPEYSIPVYSNGIKNKGLYGYTNIPRVTKPSITISARGTIGYLEIRDSPFYPIIRLIVATPNSNIIDISFLKYCIDNHDITNSGTTIPQLTVPMIKKIPLPLPPLEEQQRIVEHLEAVKSKTDQLAACYEAKLERLAQLKQAALERAFTGALL